jgi:hypothetical protein
MMSPRRRRLAAAAALAAVWPLALSAWAQSPIHSTAATPKIFWGDVMAIWYGRYDAQLKCWVQPDDRQRVCLRPAKFAVFDSADGREILVAVRGRQYAADGSPDDSHPSGGFVAFLALAEHAGSTALVARGGPFEVGADGTPPAEDAIKPVTFGAGGPHGWSVTRGATNMGITATVVGLYARIGAAIKQVAVLPDHYDDEGACDSGRNLATGEPCADYDTAIAFAAERPDGGLPAIVLRAEGSLNGRQLSGGRIIPFDRAAGAYSVPPDVTIDGTDWTRPLDGR